MTGMGQSIIDSNVFSEEEKCINRFKVASLPLWGRLFCLDSNFGASVPVVVNHYPLPASVAILGVKEASLLSMEGGVFAILGVCDPLAPLVLVLCGIT